MCSPLLQHGYTPLYVAVMESKVRVVEELLKHGANRRLSPDVSCAAWWPLHATLYSVHTYDNNVIIYLSVAWIFQTQVFCVCSSVAGKVFFDATY